jgi:hypothetical protein
MAAKWIFNLVDYHQAPLAGVQKRRQQHRECTTSGERAATEREQDKYSDTISLFARVLDS